MIIEPLRNLLILVVLLALGLTAWAQTQVSSADLKGTILDPAKAVVPGATVTATNVDTGVPRSTFTDPFAEYRVPLLPPGEYEVRVQMTGFAPLRHRGITITIGQTVVIDFELQLGAQATEIEVVSNEAPVIEIERTHQADTITQRPIQALPTNGRNFLNFSLLT